MARIKKELIDRAHKIIFKKNSERLPYYKKAEKVLKHLVDDHDAISQSLARECIYDAVQGGHGFPDERTKIRIVRLAEDLAPDYFPKLKNIREVHMDQLEVEYRQWKYPNKTARIPSRKK